MQSHQPEESGVMVPSAGASSQAEHMKQYLQWQKEKQHLQQQLRDKSLSYFEAKEQYARYQHHNEVIQMEYDFIQHQCVDLCDQMLQELHHNLAFFQEYHSRKKMRK